jgi:hypothetical protein
LIAILQTGLVFGQTAGSVSGLVTDQSGSVIAGATITATNPQTSLTRQTVSNSSGNYNLPDLPPGFYNVRAEGKGFQSEVKNGLELQVQQDARIDFQLRVGAVTDTVEVTAGAPLLNTENATVGKCQVFCVTGHISDLASLID